MSPQSPIIKGHVYGILGVLARKEDERSHTTLEYWEKSLATLKSSLDDTAPEVAHFEVKVAKMKSFLQCNTITMNPDEDLKRLNFLYEQVIEYFVPEASETISAGIQFARGQRVTYPCSVIASEKLLMKLLAISRQLRGSDHATTKKADRVLTGCRVRHVFISLKGEKCIGSGSLNSTKVAIDA